MQTCGTRWMRGIFGLPDDLRFDNYDDISFIRSLNVLTDTEKRGGAASLTTTAW